MRVTVRGSYPCLLLMVATSVGQPTSALPAASSQGGAADGDIALIGAELKRGGTNCRQLVETYLDRIARTDDRLHSIVAVNRKARAEAGRIDRLSSHERQALPLPCVPLLVKDNIDVEGMPTTAGSVALRRNVAPRDAAAVATLRRAGAIILAKTNMSEFAFNYRGRSSVRGQTLSPFSPEESAGGSSSGNASALAAGLGVVALGTDTSGSLRVPAALTGTIGLRPTFGTMPMDGVAPLSPSQDIIGPMCRHVADCRRVLDVLRPDMAQPGAADPLRGLRVGILSTLMRPDGAPERGALAALRDAGAQVRDMALRDQLVLVGLEAPAGEEARFASRSVFDFPAVMDAYLPARRHVPGGADSLLLRLKQLEAQGRTDPKVVEDVAKFAANREGAAGDPRYRINGERFRDPYVAGRIDEAFACDEGGSCSDILVYASVQHVAAAAADGPDTGGTHRLAAYSGRPAIAFPVGSEMTVAGPRPVSLEIMGRPGSERQLLAIVQAWQALLPLPHPRPCASGDAVLCLTP
ncbi:amidase [Sphingobium sp. LMA1-1-1.1]|uniref:amidase n=1 Tax=Sphingobium sp. LMA1-1-1.1 TaxID=3135238 RepID=UPI00341A02B8